VKAESDVICTSSNAAKVVASLPTDRPVLFAPDKNLGRWVMKQTGRELVLWPGSCIVHETFSVRRILELKQAHPGAKIIAHPECEEPVLALSEFIGSTAALLRFVEQDAAQTFIVATEPGILHQMQKLAPHKQFVAAPGNDETCACNLCPHMRLNTPEKVYLALRDLTPQLEMTEELRQRAKVPLDRMLSLS
jgi:quinolinate synthase